MDYVVLLDSATGLDKKLVRIYLEDSGAYRQIEQHVNIGLDVDAYMAANFASVWAAASPLAEDLWIAAQEKSFSELYRSVVQAGIAAARGPSATLDDVSDAMEAVIDASPKSGAFTKLSTMASAATAAQRDRFFLITALIILGESAGK